MQKWLKPAGSWREEDRNLLAEQERKNLVSAQLKVVGLFMLVLLAVMVIFSRYASLHLNRMDTASGSIEILQRIYRCAYNEEKEENDYTDDRVFVVRAEEDGSYTFLEGQENFSDFVENHKEELGDSAFATIDGVLLNEKTINDVSYIGGFLQTSERQADSEEMTILNQYLVSIYCLIGVGALAFAMYSMLPVLHMYARQREFVQNASHALNTPIAAVLANCEVLQSQENNEWLENIHKEADYMQTSVRELIAQTRVDTISNLTEKVNLSEVLNMLLLEYDAVAFEKEILLETEIADDVIVMGTEEELKQLCTQLAENAFKYVDGEKKWVKVSLKSGHHPELFVANSGCHIKKNEVEHLFERYYRGEYASYHQAQNGSGIGLSIVKAVCEKYRYRVAVDVQEEVSTGFTIRF